MRRKLITSADEYARQAKKHEADGLEWSATVPVDPSIWHDVLDRYPDLDNVVIDHEALPDDVIERLSRWPWDFIRYQLWLHDRLPSHVVESLLRDIDPGVRRGIANWRGIRLDQLVELHAGVVDSPILDVARVLKERFAVHWREIASPFAPIRLHPYEDPGDMEDVLERVGFPNLDPAHPGADDDWMRAIRKKGEVANWVSYSGRTPVPVLRELAASGCKHCREAVARSTDAPIKLLATLALDTSLIVRSAAARNPESDIALLLLVASDDHAWVRRSAREVIQERYGVILGPQDVVPVPAPDTWQPISSVAECVELWRSINLEDRARLKFGLLRRRVFGSSQLRADHGWILIRNQTTPEEVVEELILDWISKKRRRFSSDICPINDVTFLGRPGLADRFARHDEPTLRFLVASSPNVPIGLLTMLENDRNLRVAETARRTLRIASGWIERDSDWSGKFDSPDEILMTIRNEDPWERRGYSQLHAPQRYWREVLEQAPELAKWVAINETVGPSLLDELADWPDPEVRRWVCDHPRVWLKTLDRLASDADPSVRRRAVYNARLSDRQLRRLQSDSDPQVAAEATRRLAAREYANRLLNDPEWWRHLGNSEID
jgi:hypothetical protein